MAEKTPSQVIINTEADSSLQRVYPGTFQNIPPVVGNTSIYISTTTENIINNYLVNNDPAGNTTEIQFNLNNHMSADSGLTYNYVTDSLTVAGNLTAGNVKSDNLLYANGVVWNFNGSYSNSNVAGYLPTYTGNMTGNRITGTLFTGSGAGLTSVPAGSISGAIANANYANFAGTVITAAQPNITSTGTLASLTVTANITSGNANLGNLTTSNYFTGTLTTGAQPNITSTGTLASITHAANANITMSGSLSQISGVNLVSATNLTGTLTTGAQPNITSTGSLIGLTVSNATGVVNFTTTANVTLGSVSNLHITGGSASQFLQTNGSGTLSWATPATSNLQQVTTAGATTDVAVSITNTTESTNYNTGALKVTGGIGVANNIHVQGHISSVTTVYAGLYADFSSYTYPKFVGRDAGADYIQSAMVNTHEHGSSDWVAYGDNSDETQGWSDFGYCGSAFGDANYTITKANDGYFFVQGMDLLAGGNMVLATGDQGLNHDMVFATGGFLAENEVMRFAHEANKMFVGGHAYGSGASIDLDVNGNANVRGNITSVNASLGNLTVTANITSGNASLGNLTTTGNITGNTNGFTIGYLNIPQVSASNTTIGLTDAGKHYYSTTAGNFTLTVPNNSTTSFATGTAISIIVQAAGNILVNAASGVTLYMAGNSTAANRIVGGYGMAILMKVNTDTWFINGSGVS